MSRDNTKNVHTSKSILLVVMAIVIVAGLLAYLYMNNPTTAPTHGLKIAVTFYSLKPDIDLLTCTGDVVFSITPAGVDPHEYQLTPADVAKLKEADIIISTAHAPFETKISELVRNGEIKARLVEIPSIDGIKILRNPATGNPNYHWPIYDPENYLIYIKTLSNVFANLRPECRDTYKTKESILESNVTAIIQKAPRLKVNAIGASPVVQYAVNWMGINVSFLLIKEHDLPATPQDIAQAKDLLDKGKASFIVATNDILASSLGEKLKELSSQTNIPLLLVPSPTSPESTLQKIKTVVDSISQIRA